MKLLEIRTLRKLTNRVFTVKSVVWSNTDIMLFGVNVSCNLCVKGVPLLLLSTTLSFFLRPSTKVRIGTDDRDNENFADTCRGGGISNHINFLHYYICSKNIFVLPQEISGSSRACRFASRALPTMIGQFQPDLRCQAICRTLSSPLRNLFRF